MTDRTWRTDALARGATRGAVLLACAIVTWGLTQVRVHDRRVERLWGEVAYGTATKKADAVALAEVLRELGIFDGTRRTVRLDYRQGVHEVRIVVEPTVAVQPVIRQHLVSGFQVICERVFAGQPAIVKLANTSLISYDVLLTTP